MRGILTAILGFSILVGLLSFIKQRKVSDNLRVDSRKLIPPLRKHALLVGINKYKSSDVRNLSGCLNDIDLMKNLLIKREFLETDIKCLADNQATKGAIIGAINNLITSVNPGDVVVIHYSGHGSQVKDNESDEEIDRYDETLVPYDYVHTTEKARETSITDDTLSQLLSRLTAKTEKVTLIIDACHSGGVTREVFDLFGRDNILTDRFIDIVDTVDTKDLNGESDVKDASGFKDKSAKYVLVTASRSDEKAKEAKIAGKPYGILTQALYTELESAAPGTQVWPDVMYNVKMNVQNKNFQQEPQLEGENKDSYVFGDNVILDKQFILVSPGPNNTSVTVDAGEVLGITKGSIFKVYAPETLDFSIKNPIAEIEITETATTTAKGKIITGAVQSANSKAKEHKHNYSGSVLNIAFKGNWQGNSLQGIKSAVKAIAGINEDNQYPHLVLLAKGSKIKILFPGDTINVLSEYLTNNQNLRSELKQQIELWRKWYHVYSISNPKSNLKISVTLDTTRTTRSLELMRKPDYVFLHGDNITFNVKNLSTEKVFLNFLNLLDNGKIKAYTLGRLLGQPSNEALNPGEEIPIQLKMTVTDGKEESLDIMKVFATTRNITFSFLEQGGVIPSEPFADLLGRELNPTPKKVGVDDWYTTEKIVWVKRPG